MGSLQSYICSQIIGFCSSKAKKSKQELKELEKHIKELERKI
ncbi:MAG: hypothetical protein ACRC0V_07655 [Fusobacteriaceae bacterium]